MATLIIHNPTQEQLKHILKAERQLTKAGITFDVGHGINDDGSWSERRWELDWSLKGAEIRLPQGVSRWDWTPL